MAAAAWAARVRQHPVLHAAPHPDALDAALKLVLRLLQRLRRRLASAGTAGARLVGHLDVKTSPPDC